MIVLILTFVLATYVLVRYLKYKRVDSYLGRFSGPPPLPFLGNALDFKNTSDILPVLLKYQEKYNGLAKLTIGFEISVIISDQKFLDFLLNSTKILHKSSDYKFLSKWLGTGLLTGGGAKWKKHRKIITPAFHFTILEQFVEIFNSVSEVLVQKLEKEAGKIINIYPYITLCALDVICETAMGTSVNAQTNSESEYVRSVKEMCRIIVERSMSPFTQHDLIYLFTRDYRKEKRALNVLQAYTDSVICKRKAEIVAEKTYNKDPNRRKLVFLDILLQATIDGKPISDNDIREEVNTFMFEGHDTTASAMSFTLFCLANHPDVQQKVVEELEEIFGNDKQRPATYRDLQNMYYLETVIKETLRLYPSVPIFARGIEEDVIYDGGVLPKGLTVSIFPFGLHRQPELFPDPEKFDPDRFSAENLTGRNPYNYIPFSAGPRNCIGQKFAMLEMKSTISKVLRNFELRSVVPEHKLILVAETVLKSANGILVDIRKRDFSAQG